MATYKVLWEVEIEAESHDEAAGLALEMMQDRESTATVFYVSRLAWNGRRVGQVEVVDPMMPRR